MTAGGGRIVLAEGIDGAWMRFEGMERPPVPSVRWLPNMASARTFAIVMHQCHGWAIEEEYPGEVQA
ncbi:MAG: hypothetical protein PGN16_03835 [Sphingomonas phyllosphaerae]|uniref:hypothetical protein n=1 Tax=Sphingomonas phyllosphaerae TaxID=257003 RepID=UPI002FF97174